MPETRATLSLSRPRRSMARMSEPRTMPLPQPGHQMWGNFLSCRRYLCTSPVMPSAIGRFLSVVHLDETVADLARRDQAAVDAVQGFDAGAVEVHALHLPAHLPDVHFGHKDGPALVQDVLHVTPGKGKKRDELQKARFHPVLTGLDDGPSGRPGHGTVGDNGDLGVFHHEGLHPLDLVESLGDLPEEP